MRDLGQRIDQSFRKMRNRSRFTGSEDYWEKRYQRGGTSGAGSYNRLAQFKADFLNRFVAENNIQTVIEFGSGDGAQLALAIYPEYVGVDVSDTALEATRRRFAENPTMRFMRSDEVTASDRAQLALSLDVIYHLVEDDVFDKYMSRLFDAAEEYVIAYASNEDRDWTSPHVRHRHFTRWVEEHRPDFSLIDRVPNAYPYMESDPHQTSFADFYTFKRTV